MDQEFSDVLCGEYHNTQSELGGPLLAILGLKADAARVGGKGSVRGMNADGHGLNFYVFNNVLCSVKETP